MRTEVGTGGPADLQEWRGMGKLDRRIPNTSRCCEQANIGKLGVHRLNSSTVWENYELSGQYLAMWPLTWHTKQTLVPGVQCLETTLGLCLTGKWWPCLKTLPLSFCCEKLSLQSANTKITATLTFVTEHSFLDGSLGQVYVSLHIPAK